MGNYLLQGLMGIGLVSIGMNQANGDFGVDNFRRTVLPLQMAVLASGVEFVLEGLHLSKRLNKDASGVRATYRAKA